MQFIRTIKIFYVVSLFGLLVLMSGCKNSADETIIGFSDENTFSLSTYIENNKDTYSKFWQIIEKTNLYSTLNAYNPKGNGFTLFLPTDNAFDNYIQESDKYGSFDDLLNDSDFLNILIRYHLVNGTYDLNIFPYGAFSDSTATGDYLSIGIQISADTSIYKVNNVSPLVKADIKTTNGYIHTISKVLEPITYTGYEWLKGKESYSILTQAFEITGLDKLMGIQKASASGSLVKNNYTILAESDSVYKLANINSIDDLISKYHTEGLSFTDPNDGLYQFAAYHILQGRNFLNDFNSATNYNSFAIYPVYINSGLDIKINQGVKIFKTVISGGITIYIDYISIDMNNSNVNTKNGPIHFISEVMELYKPPRKDVIFNFLNDPLIEGLSKSNGSHIMLDPNIYEFIYWEGAQSIDYYKPSNATSDSYIEIDGNFLFRYTMPAILPGIYKVELRMNLNNSSNATIQVQIDGRKLGGNINLTTGTGSFTSFIIGTLDFTGNDYHKIEISSLIPGIMRWSSIKLIPV